MTVVVLIALNLIFIISESPKSLHMAFSPFLVFTWMIFDLAVQSEPSVPCWWGATVRWWVSDLSLTGQRQGQGRRQELGCGWDYSLSSDCLLAHEKKSMDKQLHYKQEASRWLTPADALFLGTLWLDVRGVMVLLVTSRQCDRNKNIYCFPTVFKKSGEWKWLLSDHVAQLLYEPD